MHAVTLIVQCTHSFSVHLPVFANEFDWLNFYCHLSFSLIVFLVSTSRFFYVFKISIFGTKIFVGNFLFFFLTILYFSVFDFFFFSPCLCVFICACSFTLYYTYILEYINWINDRPCDIYSKVFFKRVNKIGKIDVYNTDLLCIDSVKVEKKTIPFLLYLFDLLSLIENFNICILIF